MESVNENKWHMLEKNETEQMNYESLGRKKVSIIAYLSFLHLIYDGWELECSQELGSRIFLSKMGGGWMFPSLSAFDYSFACTSHHHLTGRTISHLSPVMFCPSWISVPWKSSSGYLAGCHASECQRAHNLGIAGPFHVPCPLSPITQLSLVTVTLFKDAWQHWSLRSDTK